MESGKVASALVRFLKECGLSVSATDDGNIAVSDESEMSDVVHFMGCSLTSLCALYRGEMSAALDGGDDGDADDASGDTGGKASMVARPSASQRIARV